MPRVTCQLCTQPATVHDTLVLPDGVLERHYCVAHGGPIWSAGLPPARSEDAPDTWSGPLTERFNDLRRGRGDRR